MSTLKIHKQLFFNVLVYLAQYNFPILLCPFEYKFENLNFPFWYKVNCPRVPV